MPVHKEFSSMEAPFFSENAAEQLSVTDEAPPHSVDQRAKFHGSRDLSSYIAGSSNIPMVESLPSFSCFGSESLSEIMDSFALPEGTQMTSSLCCQELPSTAVQGTEKNLKETKRKRMPECGIQSNFPINHCIESKQQKDVPAENDENQQTGDVSPHVKENGNTNEEDYIHVRAKRGQATNSHSLAERVRREKISERMKLLQDLVPGCNKITGKAVMLDEIINYVQSLQRQVEFLSMKLAALNPEINLDMEQAFGKESLQARFRRLPTTVGYCPQVQEGMALPSLTNYGGFLRATINHQISPMVQLSNPWDFQNAIQLGLIPYIPPHHAMDQTGDGSMKVD